MLANISFTSSLLFLGDELVEGGVEDSSVGSLVMVLSVSVRALLCLETHSTPRQYSHPILFDILAGMFMDAVDPLSRNIVG